VITRVLEQAGHTVITVTDGAAAIAETRERRPDLVLLDGEMPPGINGFDACTTLYEDPATSMIPVMMVTGSMPPAQVRQRMPHVRHVLGKPFTAQELRTCVQQALNADTSH
jgi:twitching motility two-component system response regulator PilH